MSEITKQEQDEILHELSLIIARHSSLTGREFQRLALQAAEAYYGAEDIDDYFEPRELLNALDEAMANNPLVFPRGEA